MRADRRPPMLFALGVLLCVLLAACSIPGIPGGQTPPTSPSPQTGSPSPSATPGEDCRLTMEEGGDAKVEIGANDNFEEINKDIKKAERFVDGFWQRHWDQCFADAEYRAPEKRNVYTANDPESCDGTSMDADNAFYCSDGHFVAYGRALMRRALEDNVETPWVYLVVAHEWGHAVQQLLTDGGYDQLVPNPLDGKHELQADCLAGAALWGSDYEGFLEWKSANSVQVAKALLTVSEETPWTRVTPDGEVRTGGPLARVAAFQAGLGQDGATKCFSSYA